MLSQVQLHKLLLQEINRCVKSVIHFNLHPENLHIGVIKIYKTNQTITMIFQHVEPNYIIKSYIKTSDIYNYIV